MSINATRGCTTIIGIIKTIYRRRSRSTVHPLLRTKDLKRPKADRRSADKGLKNNQNRPGPRRGHPVPAPAGVTLVGRAPTDTGKVSPVETWPRPGRRTATSETFEILFYDFVRCRVCRFLRQFAHCGGTGPPRSERIE